MLDKYWLKAPFTYFGGKSKIAHIVWQALGDVEHYIEPFFGSGAVLLSRPDYNPQKHIETVNDKDAMLCNVWRSLQYDPDEVAKFADWPVNHADLIARKKFLIKNEKKLLDNLTNDPDWYDPKAAGFWIWSASCWIGHGLYSINQRPEISKKGAGINKFSLRHKSNFEKDVRESYNMNIYKWFRILSERLRYVRVVCGDWTKICSGNWQDLYGKSVGIFMDPPYSIKDRDKYIYYCDDLDVAKDVEKWCLERGKRNTYRIVLAGYYEEHKKLLENGWSVYRWKTTGGYSSLSKNPNTQGKINKYREALFLSPYCLDINKEQMLFNIEIGK